MKKVILMTGILCVFNLAMLDAQTGEGKVLLGLSSSIGLSGNGFNMMSLEFTSSKFINDASDLDDYEPHKSTAFNFLPKIGYFVSDKLALGLDISYSLSNTKDNTPTDTSTKNRVLFGVGPFVRYYIPRGKVLPFLELGGSLGSINNKDEYNGTTNKFRQSFSTIGGGAGIAAPLGDHVSFDLMLDYQSSTVKASENNPTNNRGVQGTLGLKVGFTVFLGKAKNKEIVQ